MRKMMITILILIGMLSVSCISFIPSAAGDGMPAVSYTGGGKEPLQVFSSIFESRQLAVVELTNDTHERISLFLSVYSLDPGDNLTILVPLRTLPAMISGEPIKERDFRKVYNIERAEEEVVKQDMDVAMTRLGDRTREYFMFAFGSMAWTMPGEYTRQKIHRTGGYSGMMYAMEGAGSDTYGTPEPVQHYEFDGFSIDVFNVSTGPILSDYLEQKGLAIPDAGELDKYNNHYIAIIESETKPPITESKFEDLQNFTSNSMDYLISELREEPDKNEYEIQSLKSRLDTKIYQETQDNLSYQKINELKEYMDELVDAVFSTTDFEGEVIHVELPLDNGKVFFPLGTSGGWPNAIGDIDILFKVPEDKALDLPESDDAFFDGSHWYLIQMENANPDYDLESPISKADADRRSAMQRAGFIYDNAAMLGFLIIAGIVLLMWFGTAFIIKKVKKKTEKKVLRNPALWVLLGLSLIVSIPGALLVLLIAKPVQPNRLTKDLLPLTMLILYPLTLLLALVGVLL